ncbi:MAG: hypothetical protein R3A10_16705 [Caldilineaceae bacterium]
MNLVSKIYFPHHVAGGGAAARMVDFGNRRLSHRGAGSSSIAGR